MHEITVRPGEAVGWNVEHAKAQPVVFRSGAEAEAAAWRLVRRLAAAGMPARATVLLRDGSIAGRLMVT